MASVTICSYFGAQVEEICHSFYPFPLYLPCNNESRCHYLSFFFFLIFSFKLALLLLSFTLIKRLFSSSLLSAIRVVTSAYLRLLILLPPILIPACNPTCRGPAPVDPGSSKGGRRWRGKTCLFINVRLD